MLRPDNEITYDLFFSNSVERCFNFEAEQIASAKILINEWFKAEKSEELYSMVIRIMPLVLKHDDPFKSFNLFFFDFAEDTTAEDE
jgi:hypothetical protein